MFNPNTIQVASFDIGKKNFSFVIEEINLPEINEIPTIPQKFRYTKSGACTEEFADILERVNKSSKIILAKHIDITNGETKKKNVYIDPQWFLNLTNILDSYLEYWQNCTTFIIEQQMSFGKKHNTLALKIGQHCFSYFLFHFANFKVTMEFPSYYKTRIHGASRKLSKYQRKKWSVDKAMNMLINKEDQDTLKLLTNLKKKDDISDCIVMLNAYKFMCFVDKCI